MATFREAEAAKRERTRRERRFFTADMLGRPCPECGIRMTKESIAAGENTHPTCGPMARAVGL